MKAFVTGAINISLSSRVHTPDAVALRASVPRGLRSAVTTTPRASTTTSTRAEPEPPKLEVPKALTSKTKKMGLFIIAAGALAATAATVIAPLTAVGGAPGCLASSIYSEEKATLKNLFVPRL